MGLGTPELIVIFLIILLFFGAKRLPEIARSLGKASNEFKKAKITMSRADVKEVEENMARFRALEASTPVLTEKPEEVEVDVQKVEDFLKGDL